MLALLLLAEVAAGAPAPASPPPPAPVEHLRKVVIDAIRNCPEHKPDEIVVCSPDRGVAEGYRIPKLDARFAGTGLRPSGRGKADGADVGKTGIGSCSKVGAGGTIGCGAAEYRAWKAERRADRAAPPPE